MKSRPLVIEDIEYLVAATAQERVFVGESIHEDYSHDEMTEYGSAFPGAVVEVVSTEEVQAVMRYCYQNDIPVTPRGSGTGLCGACVPICGGVILSTVKMDSILEIDHETMTVTCQPGVLLMNLAKACLDEGLLYPPDPGEKSATVGGNVMTNAGGMRAVKYGVTRDYVRGLEAVLPDGRLMKFGGKVSKNSSGYSLKDLLIGSEGTLAIITGLYLKVIPSPRLMNSLLIPFNSIDACLDAVKLVLQSTEIPTTIEFMEREVILDAQEYLGKDFPDVSANAYMLVSFNGDSKRDIERHYEYVAETCLGAGATNVFISDTEERQDSIWSARGAFLEAIKSSTPSMDECDVVVPINRVAEFIAYTKTLAKEFSIRIRSFGHAGDGNLHVYVCQDALEDSVWKSRCRTIMDRLYAKAVELGGLVSGEHGIGHAKRQYLLESVGEEQVALMRGIKAVFDPKGLLNPGKIV